MGYAGAAAAWATDASLAYEPLARHLIDRCLAGGRAARDGVAEKCGPVLVRATLPGVRHAPRAHWPALFPRRQAGRGGWS